MSNHHYVNVVISGTNTAAAANAVKEQAKKHDMLLEEPAVESNKIVLLSPYSGMEAVVLIADLSKQFPIEQFDLNVGTSYGGKTFQGTMTIQNGRFFDVLDSEGVTEWTDMCITERAVYRLAFIGLRGKKKISINAPTGSDAEQLAYQIGFEDDDQDDDEKADENLLIGGKKVGS